MSQGTLTQQKCGRSKPRTTKPAVVQIEELAAKLFRVLEDACAHGYIYKELTVQSAQIDPYQLDTPANHREGKWAAQQLARAYSADRQAHLRGLHYAMVSKKTIVRKPDGDIYRNTHDDWLWLVGAVKAARWLGYIPFDPFMDRRNPDPIIHRKPRPSSDTWIDAGLAEIDLEHIEPTPNTGAFVARHAFHSVIFGEKASLEEVLLPLAEKHDADLYLCTGEISDTLIYRMAKDAVRDGRPLVVFTVTDCDPSGCQMPVSIARKLQAFRDLRFPSLRFEIVQAALTIDQVEDLDLPSTPLKDTELRAVKWKEAFGVEQTEVDALLTPEHLQANTLYDLVDEVMTAYRDSTLEDRIEEAKTEWTDAAQEAIDNAIDQDELDAIREEAAAVADKIDEINDRLNTGERRGVAVG